MLITYIIFYIENIISIIILHLNFDIFNYAKYKEFIFKYSSLVLPFSVQNKNLILSSIGGSNYIANRCLASVGPTQINSLWLYPCFSLGKHRVVKQTDKLFS